MIRLAVIGDARYLRTELPGALRASGRSIVLGVAATLNALESELVARADVLLLDGSAASAIGTSFPPDALPALVILADESDVPQGWRTFGKGLALLPADATVEEVLAAAEAAAVGLVTLHPAHAGAFFGEGGEDDAPGPAPGERRGTADETGHLAPSADLPGPLSAREGEVLQMLAAGLGNKSIAQRLGISEHTAKFHVSRILAKLDAGTRAEAVSVAMRRGLLAL